MGTLDDSELAAEIALLGEVIAALAAAPKDLTDREVDQILGVPATDPETKDTG